MGSRFAILPPNCLFERFVGTIGQQQPNGRHAHVPRKKTRLKFSPSNKPTQRVALKKQLWRCWFEPTNGSKTTKKRELFLIYP
ncbi:MAG: hypothetical protein EAZ70_06360 [Runella slithyformis]|nr:MAG: hypothetical protein EAZ70_06360 [Runella slithyformis]TAF44633.1 MAG: hypothetical protein EAZ63_12180 [Runella slithyformis]